MNMTTVAEELNQLTAQGLYRRLDSHDGVDFSSNDFLGLAHSPLIREALISHLKNGKRLGSTGSRLISGNDQDLEAAEAFVAEYFAAPAVLFFGSGYLANLGTVGALGHADSVEFFSDELNHASLIDGLRLARAPVCIFRHNDLDHLVELLRDSSAQRKVVVTESIFSMDGDGPDLVRLKKIIDEQNAFLILDEAHATGVLGANGLGAAEGLGLDPERTICVHTCGKALGGYGAFVTTSASVRELLINRARSFFYSTAPTPLQVAQTRAALVQLRRQPELREDLRRNALALQAGLHEAGATTAREEPGHIVSIKIPGVENVLRAAEHLRNKGFHVKAIRHPTVPLGTERLRLTVKAFHQPQDIDLLTRALKEVLL